MEIAQRGPWKRLSVAVAYSSVAGVTKMHEIVTKHNPEIKVRWLLGLDDYITSPGAVEFCDSSIGSQTKIYQSKNKGTRFHPKLYIFESEKSADNLTACVGSTNLTKTALLDNCEAGAILETKNNNDAHLILSSFDVMWNLGKKPSKKIMQLYSEDYKKFKSSRSFFLQDTNSKKKTQKRLVLNDDLAEKSPDLATVCWIEVGKNTAMGRELEFKGEQARYFDLSPHGGDAENRSFLVSDNKKIKLRMKYQGNSMWRLQMTKDVPEASKGLRPISNGKLGRSPYVAVFEKLKNKHCYALSFIHEKSADYKNIKKHSKKLGTIGHTTTRNYGWY